VNCEWARVLAGAEPVADELALEEERTACAALVLRPIALGGERAMRDADGRDVEDGAEVERDARTARMVAARGVDEKDVRLRAERSHRRLEQRALAKREQARLVRQASLAFDNGAFATDGGRGPREVTGLAGAGPALGEADEAPAARPPARRRLPWWGLGSSELELELDQRFGCGRPVGHRPILGFVEALVEAAVAAGVTDERVLEAIRAVPRVEFVPGALAAAADVDQPLAIPHEQVTTQPSLVARMVEALALEGSERVLEIGTGYGWQTALLARLAERVLSVERFTDLARAARGNLERIGVENVVVVVGDGSQGLSELAPFDAILVSAAFPEVPGPLAEQLAEGGRLVQPIGPGGDDDVLLFLKRGGELARERFVSGARFVRLYGRYGYR
jgi:protein-L-isoaspartate(D-aspartate) O-methyltransferase